MRKTSYAITFLLVAANLALNIVAVRRPDWLVDDGTEILYTRTTVRYGLTQRCERQIIKVPGPSDGSEIIYYSDYTCRAFPMTSTDRCERGNRYLCTAWTSAGYVAELGIGFGAMALFAILIGVSTHSRRRRIWRAVAGLVACQALFPMITFAVVTDLYRTSRYVGFEYAHFSTGYYANAAAWVASVFVMFGVIWTGIAADKGHKWAAGNRAYRRIEDRP
ncbi:hypothetical protein BV25DRAFT_1803088 [Artomyces pyxidatus]|uniref:Uncharacterized protein n=1 Tax=Artomyces pyxidatus TaxID=48021 RepID=A0ACB8T429_9AGAM|nr:hypothetical protein BV25DRAFT_1803088 [Artomyces pyxidatus]